VSTALVDVTFDYEIAAWFATHGWMSSDSKLTGSGVIYRLNLPLLQKAFAFYTETSRQQARAENRAPTPPLFIEDIRDIPETFAARPSRQRGASVYGFDQIGVLELARTFEMIEVFEFPHSPIKPISERLTKTISHPLTILSYRCWQDFRVPNMQRVRLQEDIRRQAEESGIPSP
jgi:hypothetical protein